LTVVQANILINDNWQACLTDFGLTVFDDATPVSFSSRNSGSVRWMAPELHVPERFGLARSCLTPETDVYAFGCVCLEVSSFLLAGPSRLLIIPSQLYTGRPPFANVLVDSAVMFQVVHGGRPERPTGDGEMIDQLWRMVEMCWSQHFADRLKTDEVVEFTRKLSDVGTILSLHLGVELTPSPHSPKRHPLIFPCSPKSPKAFCQPMKMLLKMFGARWNQMLSGETRH